MQRTEEALSFLTSRRKAHWLNELWAHPSVKHSLSQQICRAGLHQGSEQQASALGRPFFSLQNVTLSFWDARIRFWCVRSYTGRSPSPTKQQLSCLPVLLANTSRGSSPIKGSGLSSLWEVVQLHLVARDTAQLFVSLLHSSKTAASQTILVLSPIS